MSDPSSSDEYICGLSPAKFKPSAHVTLRIFVLQTSAVTFPSSYLILMLFLYRVYRYHFVIGIDVVISVGFEVIRGKSSVGGLLPNPLLLARPPHGRSQSFLLFLDQLPSVGLRVLTDERQHFYAGRLLRPVRQRHGHFSVREGLRGMRPERQFGSEHRLTLKTGSLSYEEVIVVPLDGRRKQQGQICDMR